MKYVYTYRPIKNIFLVLLHDCVCVCVCVCVCARVRVSVNILVKLDRYSSMNMMLTSNVLLLVFFLYKGHNWL